MNRAVIFVTVVLFGLSTINLSAQDTMRVKDFKNHVVSSYKVEKSSESTLNIRGVFLDSFSMGANYNLCDMMARVPGVTILSTGPGISKPVIRGLSGNRVLILLNGLKFDNQQWQEEHGLGLSEAGFSKVEIIKGPLGILYGSEAIGGVINLIEEDKAEAGHTESDVRVKLYSNSLGGNLIAGFKANYGKSWFGLRFSIDNHADYFDGNNRRVLNSRMDGYMFKANYGFRRKNWTSNNHLLSSFNRFGFIFNDIYTFVTEDARYNRSLSVNPAHLVLLNVLNSENNIKINKNQNLKVNLGVQSNRRMENEGGGAISLDMHLLTGQYQLKWSKQLEGDNSLMLSASSVLESNVNYGARKIVPDANMSEHLFSGLLELQLSERFKIENGAGIGIKRIHTFFTNSVNGPDKEIKPFVKRSPYGNFMSGIVFKLDSMSSIKFNVASGVRMANLAELSSDGLHEGVFTYEIGNPNLKNEQNFAFNLDINIQKEKWGLGFSPFLNYFNNYIFLAPTIEEWNGFPVFRYMQTNAVQKGGELELIYNPAKTWQLDMTLSGMTSTMDSGKYTPYTPANKLLFTVQKQLTISGKSIFVSAIFEHNDAQKQLYIHELGTPAYNLIHAALRGYFDNSRSIEWQFSVRNITNEAYYDHLSRFKYFGLLNMGRNFVCAIKWNFSGLTK